MMSQRKETTRVISNSLLQILARDDGFIAMQIKSASSQEIS